MNVPPLHPVDRPRCLLTPPGPCLTGPEPRFLQAALPTTTPRADRSAARGSELQTAEWTFTAVRDGKPEFSLSFENFWGGQGTGVAGGDARRGTGLTRRRSCRRLPPLSRADACQPHSPCSCCSRPPPRLTGAPGLTARSHVAPHLQGSVANAEFTFQTCQVTLRMASYEVCSIARTTQNARRAPQMSPASLCAVLPLG